MNRARPDRILAVLGRDPVSVSARLWAQAQRLLQLERILHQALPAAVAQHCRIANLHERVLTVVADSPVWAARLRFHTPQLKEHISCHVPVPLRAIRVIIQPKRPEAPQIDRTAPRLSPRNARALAESALALADSDLRAALLRLAKRAEDPAKN